MVSNPSFHFCCTIIYSFICLRHWGAVPSTICTHSASTAHVLLMINSQGLMCVFSRGCECEQLLPYRERNIISDSFLVMQRTFPHVGARDIHRPCEPNKTKQNKKTLFVYNSDQSCWKHKQDKTRSLKQLFLVHGQAWIMYYCQAFVLLSVSVCFDWAGFL